MNTFSSNRLLALGFFAYAIFYIIIHLYTLSISPLPWFDETYMASIAQAFIETGELKPQVALVRKMNQELIYGPVYFAITGTFIKFFGLKIIPFRITAFVSGLLVMLTAGKLFRMYFSNIKLLGTFIICLSLDPFLNRSMHEGRMDLLALFFVLVASVYLIKLKEHKHVKQAIWAGLFSVLALLTTPRAGFFFVAWLLIWLVWLIKDWQALFNVSVICGGIVLSIYSCWVLYAFGGFSAMIDYYSQYLMFTRLNSAETSIMKQQYLLIAIGLLCLLIGSLKFGRKYFNPVTTIAFLSVFCFYFLVFDQGPYAVFIVPSYYLMVFGFVGSFKATHKKIPKV